MSLCAFLSIETRMNFSLISAARTRSGSKESGLTLTSICPSVWTLASISTWCFENQLQKLSRQYFSMMDWARFFGS